MSLAEAGLRSKTMENCETIKVSLCCEFTIEVHSSNNLEQAQEEAMTCLIQHMDNRQGDDITSPSGVMVCTIEGVNNISCEVV
jgi:hypothetical protein